MNVPSYAPPLGFEGRTPSLDPTAVASYAAALAAHEGRLRTIPRVIRVTAPAAGADWSVKVDPGVVWRVLSARCRLVTDANVANRTYNIAFSDGTDEFCRSGVSVGITASQTTILTAAPGLNGQLATLTNLTFAMPSPALPLVGQTVIQSVTNAIQVGDQFTQIVIYVLESQAMHANERAAYMESLASGQNPDPYPGLLIGV